MRDNTPTTAERLTRAVADLGKLDANGYKYHACIADMEAAAWADEAEKNREKARKSHAAGRHIWRPHTLSPTPAQRFRDAALAAEGRSKDWAEFADACRAAAKEVVV